MVTDLLWIHCRFVKYIWVAVCSLTSHNFTNPLWAQRRSVTDLLTNIVTVYQWIQHSIYQNERVLKDHALFGTSKISNFWPDGLYWGKSWIKLLNYTVHPSCSELEANSCVRWHNTVNGLVFDWYPFSWFVEGSIHEFQCPWNCNFLCVLWKKN